jgi:hypothetical protein
MILPPSWPMRGHFHTRRWTYSKKSLDAFGKMAYSIETLLFKILTSYHALDQCWMELENCIQVPPIDL